MQSINQSFSISDRLLIILINRPTTNRYTPNHNGLGKASPVGAHGDKARVATKLHLGRTGQGRTMSLSCCNFLNRLPSPSPPHKSELGPTHFTRHCH